MGKLDGKVAVITGSNKGIGKGIARAFVKNGASVVLAARNEDDLNKTREELSSLVNPEHILSVPTDVTDESQVENLFAGLNVKEHVRNKPKRTKKNIENRDETTI